MRHRDFVTMLDCRFLGRGGAGRATELLLRGLLEVRPPGRWRLWGPKPVAQYLWPGATWDATARSPLTCWGQASLLSIPTHDVAIYMHQIRPMRPGPSVTVIHDTIPLHFGNPSARRFKKLFFRVAARLSNVVMTDSMYSARCLQDDLGISPEKIRVIRFPMDDEMVARVQALRHELPSQKVILFAGRFAPHKNLERLISAFARTRFYASGGNLQLVGGTDQEVARLQRQVARLGISRVVIEGICSQERLEELYATSSLLVLPSLEEGFGLPAYEALSAGLRVSVSDGGALPEIFGGEVTPFPAESIELMAAALDRDVTGPVPQHTLGERPADFARAFVSEVNSLMKLGIPR